MCNVLRAKRAQIRARCARKFAGTVNDVRAPPIPSDFACGYQLFQNGLQLQCQFGIVAAFMELIDVNEIGLQTAQAVLHIGPHILDDLVGVTVNRFLFFVDDMTKLCGNDNFIAFAFQCAT